MTYSTQHSPFRPTHVLNWNCFRPWYFSQTILDQDICKSEKRRGLSDPPEMLFMMFTALIAGCWGYKVVWLIYCLGLVLVQLSAWYFPTVISHMFKSHSIPWNQSFRGCKNYSTLPIPLSSFSAPEFKFRWSSPWSLLWHRSMIIIIIIKTRTSTF